MDDYVVVDAVSKRIKNQQILDCVSLNLKSGETYGFVGHNGCGKTMLFKTICGFALPDKGKVVIEGKQIGKDVDFPPDTGIIIERPGLIPYLTAYENLQIFAVDAKSKKKIREFSLGMKQRVGIAQAIMENPKLLVLDEPMNGLDRAGVGLVKGVLREMHHRGCTILLSSHIAGDVEELATHIFRMENGSILKSED